MKFKVKGILGIILGITSLCAAETIIVDSAINGWYDHRGYSLGSNGNNVSMVGLGDLGDTSYTYNGYFIFPIPEITDEITDIQLVLELTGYFSYDLSEDILISGVSTAPEELKLPHTLPDPGVAPWIYNDLRDGPEFGILTVDLGTLYPFIYLSQYQNDGKGPLFSCSLNEAAIQAVMESSGELFALGLSLMDITLEAGATEESLVFSKDAGDPDYWVHQLHITTVPEPCTIAFFSIGLFLLRKRKIKQ